MWRRPSTISPYLLQATNHLAEAEPLYRRALAIDEASYGPDHPGVARDLDNLASLLQAKNRLAEAEPLSRRHLEILLSFTAHTGHPHQHLRAALGNYFTILRDAGRSAEAAQGEIAALLEKHGVALHQAPPAYASTPRETRRAAAPRPKSPLARLADWLGRRQAP